MQAELEHSLRAQAEDAKEMLSMTADAGREVELQHAQVRIVVLPCLLARFLRGCGAVLG